MEMRTKICAAWVAFHAQNGETDAEIAVSFGKLGATTTCMANLSANFADMNATNMPLSTVIYK